MTIDYILTIDGEEMPQTLSEFLAANAESLDDDEIRLIVNLRVGEEFSCGGGAAPEWSILRVELFSQ